MEMSFAKCPQCGFSHPPVKSGEKCPLAKEVSPSGQIIDFDSFFVSLKNILTSKIQTKDIKDSKKFLGNILINITKLSEEYSE